MSAVRLRVRTPALHLVAGPLVGCGVVETVAYAAIAVLGGLPTLLLPGLLPLAWLVAGAIALRARPGHSGAMLLALLGVLHLAAVLLDAVTHERFPLVLSGTASSVAAPEGLLIVAMPWSVGALAPLLAVVGAGMLVARGRRAAGDLGPRLTWAVAAGGTLALLLLATPPRRCCSAIWCGR